MSSRHHHQRKRRRLSVDPGVTSEHAADAPDAPDEEVEVEVDGDAPEQTAEETEDQPEEEPQPEEEEEIDPEKLAKQREIWEAFKEENYGGTLPSSCTQCRDIMLRCSPGATPAFPAPIIHPDP